MESGKLERECAVQLEEDEFGLFTDPNTGETTPVRRFTWKNSSNVTVQVISYGATVTSVKIPSKDGHVDDVVLGYDNMEGYLNPLNPYFGATVGRVANRIGLARFTIDDVTYNVSANLGKHQLHGGFRAFDKQNWNHRIEGNRVVMTHLSGHNDEGFPGDVLVTVVYELTDDNELLVDFYATTTKATYVNLTNHSYFNLAGHDKGAAALYDHVVAVNADRITDVDEDSIPTGKLLSVSGTIFDLRIPKVLGDVIHKVPGYDGYDHNFCITKASKQTLTFVARLVHPNTARALEIYSNQPGVQFYTSNSLKAHKGKGGSLYDKHGALCFETQNWPDAINHKNFPPAVLYPGKTYHHSVVYKFFVN